MDKLWYFKNLHSFLLAIRSFNAEILIASNIFIEDDKTLVDTDKLVLCWLIETLIALLDGSKCCDWYTVNPKRNLHLVVSLGQSIGATLAWFGVIVCYKTNLSAQDSTIPGTGSPLDRAISKLGELITELTIMFDKGRIGNYASKILIYAQVYPQPSQQPSTGWGHVARRRNPD